MTLNVSSEHGASSCGGTRIVYAPQAERAPVSSSSIAATTTTRSFAGVDGDPVTTTDTRIYVANPDRGTVTRISNSNVKYWEKEVGDTPRTLAVAPNGDIWVANEGSDDVAVLARSGRLRRTIDLGYGSAPYGIAHAPDGKAVYVTLSGKGRVLKLSSRGEELGSCDVGPQPRGIAVSGDSRRILVTRFVSEFVESDGAGDGSAVGEVHEIDAGTFTHTRTFRLAFDPGPDSEDSGRGVPNYLSQVRIAPDGKSAWIPSKKDNIAAGSEPRRRPPSTSSRRRGPSFRGSTWRPTRSRLTGASTSTTGTWPRRSPLRRSEMPSRLRSWGPTRSKSGMRTRSNV